MRIIAADSGGAILKDDYEPTCIVGTAAVLVEPPYRHPSVVLWKPFEYNLNEREPILNEMLFCLELLKKCGADVIHLDISLGGVNLFDLDAKRLANYKVSPRGRRVLEGLIPKLKNSAKGFDNIKILLVGKDSSAVRIAELTVGINGLLYIIDKFMKEEKEKALYGLPRESSVLVGKNHLTIKSLKVSEFDISITVNLPENLLNDIEILEYPNPIASGFRVIELRRRR